MGWSNERYAEWMISKRVNESTMCLVEVEWDEKQGSYLPCDLFQISRTGLDGHDLIAPMNGRWFQQMYFVNKHKDGYIIGISKPFKTVDRNDFSPKKPEGSVGYEITADTEDVS